MKMAGMSQVLTHRNPTHATDSFLRLSKLRREGILCDLTILVQGQKFKAHKVVMAACSDYFLTAICGGKSTASVSLSDGDNHMTIELQYVTMRGFAPLLEYAYTSELKVNASDVIDVLSAASYMQMFNVANACSEFMRSNLLWTQNQSRLAGLPLLPAGRRSAVLNGQHNEEHSSTSPSHGRPNGFPEAVNNLLQVTSAIQANGAGRPPMLIPISSMNPYEVNLQHWADTMAGTQNLISRLVNGQSSNALSSPPSSMSPASPSQASPSRNWGNENRPSSLQPPSAPNRPNSQPSAQSEGGSPRRKDDECTSAKEEHLSEHEFPSPRSANVNTSNNNNNNNNSNNGSLNNDDRLDKQSVAGSSRKSLAVKVESRSGDEMHSNIQENTDQRRQNSPSADAEDSWQSLQRLYSFNRPEINVPGAGKLPGSSDENNTEFLRKSMSPSLLNCIASNNGLKAALMDKYKDAVPKLDNNSLSMVPNLNGLSVHRAILQHQQQLLAQQQQQLQQVQRQQRNTEEEKVIPELPVMPPGGQYMSVRRRTLQSSVPKPHQCQICGSRFTRFHNLKQHIKLHSGIKPYECDECGKRFTRNYTLRLHKMKHVGMRNFRCGTCDAAFTSLGEYRAHLRITLHSHLPSKDANQESAPEDLSNGPASGNPPRFGNFDYYGVDSPGSSGGGAAGEGSTGTISPPGNPAASHMMLGMESPHMSDQSLSGSPQDLSTKRSSSDEEKTAGGNASDFGGLSPKRAAQELQSSELLVNKKRRLDCESSVAGSQNNGETNDAEDNDGPLSLVVDPVNCGDDPN